ncbi:MAG: CinA family protein [Lachnospiraceae bacterium]|nr:CinA family protein [Lachnospiraceae bacterium]
MTDRQQLPIEEYVVDILKRNHLQIATAESCTGGLVAATLINAAGVSSVLEESYVTYSDGTKMKILGVSEDTLARYTAVSEETARQMVSGVCRVAGTDVGISVTGIAGPDGGSEEFPVGLVYIGWNIRGHITVRRYEFPGDRQQVRFAAVEQALSVLPQLMEEEGYR